MKRKPVVVIGVDRGRVGSDNSWVTIRPPLARHIVRPTDPLTDQLRAQIFHGCVVLVDYLLGFLLEVGDVGGTRVVHIVLTYIELGRGLLLFCQTADGL